jgi:hypothetical protein
MLLGTSAEAQVQVFAGICHNVLLETMSYSVATGYPPLYNRSTIHFETRLSFFLLQDMIVQSSAIWLLLEQEQSANQVVHTQPDATYSQRCIHQTVNLPSNSQAKVIPSEVIVSDRNYASGINVAPSNLGFAGFAAMTFPMDFQRIPAETPLLTIRARHSKVHMLLSR